MRSISLLLIGAALVGCSTAPPPPAMRSAQGQEQFQRLLAGKVAGPPVSCLPSTRNDDMTVIDEDTVIFRQSGNRVYLGHMAGGCNMLGQGGYALGDQAARIVGPVPRRHCHGGRHSQRLHGRQLRDRGFCPLHHPRQGLALVERVEALAIDLADHVPPDLHRRRQLLVLDREALVGEDEAAYLSITDRSALTRSTAASSLA